MPERDSAGAADSPINDEARPLVPPFEVLITVFVTGALVMTVEVVGTRVIGPVFGVSLFVWSALLAVTLGSLAIGYYAGGLLADRKLSPFLLGQVTATAGGLVGLIPLFCQSVLRLSEGFGARGGPFVAATVLFAPALVALAMAGPISVKLATRSLARAGRGIGSVFAVSTAGSLFGTLLVGSRRSRRPPSWPSAQRCWSLWEACR